MHPVELLPFLALGFLGSLHCVGMCGGFALLAGSGSRRRGGRGLSALASYAVGKAATYALVGLAVSTGVHAASDAMPLGESLPALQGAANWLAGATLVLFGIAQITGGVGGIATGALTRRLGTLTAPARRALEAVRALPGLSGTFGLGLVNGLVPCGLSWSAFVLAAASSPPVALVGSFLFGLATAPALLAFAFGSHFVPGAMRRRGAVVLGTLLIAFGASLFLRTAGRAAEGAPPDCCGTADADAVVTGPAPADETQTRR